MGLGKATQCRKCRSGLLFGDCRPPSGTGENIMRVADTQMRRRDGSGAGGMTAEELILGQLTLGLHLGTRHMPGFE